MRSRNTRFQPSWLCRLVAGELRSSHILEDQVLNESQLMSQPRGMIVLTIEASMRAG